MKTLMFLIPAFLLLSTPSFSDVTASKPSAVKLTIYNQNFALVSEQREMTLANGINLVSVPDVAATIEPSSIAFKSITAPNSVVVREQNYRYDVINPTTILDKSVGKHVKVRIYSGAQVQEVEGILLNPATPPVARSDDANGYLPPPAEQGLVIQTSNGIVTVPTSWSQDSIEVESLPDGLYSKPTLVWKLEAERQGLHQTEVSYLADSITWKADYVAVIDALDKYIDLTGWVTLDNKSGATYENASLNLIAGDVHRVQPPRPIMMAGAMGGMIERNVAAEPQFTEKAFFEYHLYTLKDKTTVRDKETKQITLMTATHIPATKTYVYDGRKSWWMSMGTDYRPGESYDVSPNKKVAVMLEVANTKDNHLGIPLPKGTIRVYKEEENTNQHFVGEDEIDHTPKDEKIHLYLGNAFDIVGEHERTNFRRISPHEVEESFQITVRDHKDTPVSVLIVDHLFGDWTITESSTKHNKRDASTVEFPVNVSKDGQTVVTYTVRTKW